MPENELDCCVVGGGPAGLVAALALTSAAREYSAECALTVTLVAAAQRISDGRTAALFNGCIRLLDYLDVWDELAQVSAPLLGIRLADNSSRILRTPEVLFSAREIGVDQLGFNVPNSALVDCLWKRVRGDSSIRVVEDTVANVTPEQGFVTLHLGGGLKLHGHLIVGADGRNSVCRSAAGIDADTWDYPQSAVVARFSHTRPHFGISTEIQDAAGPCTTVPLPDDASSLVWVVAPDDAERLSGLAAPEFAAELEQKLGGLLGSVSACADIQCFPLSGMAAKALAQNRVALIGEAAHVVPPVGAQGLNMGLGDAAQIAELAASAFAEGQDPGDDDVLRVYNRDRGKDVWRRSAAVDALNRSYFSRLLPGHLLRGAGLHAMAAIGPLKRSIMRQGLEPSPLPLLMR